MFSGGLAVCPGGTQDNYGGKLAPASAAPVRPMDAALRPGWAQETPSDSGCRCRGSTTAMVAEHSPAPLQGAESKNAINPGGCARDARLPP